MSYKAIRQSSKRQAAKLMSDIFCKKPSVSKKLHSLRNCIPREFERKPRHLNELDKWKATEYRQFLLYTGTLVLKYVLEPQFYEHFLKLSLATRILLDSEDCINKNELAKSLLCSFVEETQNLYNVSMLTCNFHYLLHINEDAKLYGSLDNISAFKFENHLQKIKKV